MSCLQLATKDDENANFLTNAVCKRHLDDIWTRCGVDDWPRLGVNFFICLSLILFITSAFARAYSNDYVFNVVVLSFAGACFMIFLLSYTALHRTRFHRGTYACFRPVSREEEKEDLKRMEILKRNEADLLLEVGIPFDLLYEKNKQEKLRIASSKKNRIKSWADGQLREWFTELLLYLDAPQTKFLMHVFTYSVYLIVFAYLILSADGQFSVTTPSSTEWLLICYWISFFAHELKQFYRGDVKSLVRSRRQKIKFKLYSYLDSIWNRVDVFLFVYFVVMMIVRFVVVWYLQKDPTKPTGPTTMEPPPPSSSSSSSSSVMLSAVGVAPETNYVFVLNLYSFYFVCWCLRLLQLFAVSESLGPKLIMIRLMIDDVLKIFLYVMIFLVAYAVWLKVAIKTVSKEFLTQEREVCVLSP